MPLLSIITINYNNKAGLGRTVESVVEQSARGIEFIVIDGGSSDGSKELIEKSQNHIAYWRSEKDAGIYDAMNKGILAASGDYLLFLNSGDHLFENNTIEKIIPHLESGADIVYGDMKIESDGRMQNGFMPERLTLQHLLKDTLWHPVSFIRRELFFKYGLYDTSYKICGDYDFFFKAIVAHKASTEHVPQFISVFDMGGISSKADSRELIKAERERAQLHSAFQNLQEGKVSVIIPAYNYGRYIAQTLESVLKQSCGNWECLIIDNGSTDNTYEVVAPFLSDERMHYVKQDNLGVSVARNVGLHLAKGEFIQFLDADDLIEYNKLETEINYLKQNPGTDLVYGDMRYFKTTQPQQLFYSYACSDKDDKPWMSYASGSGKPLAEQFLNGNCFVISSPLFRKSSLKDIGFFDSSIQYNEDWDLWFRMALAGKMMHYLDAAQSKTLIRIHDGSASRDIFSMQVCGLKVLVKNSAAIKNNQLNARLQKRMADHVRIIRQILAREPGESFDARLRLLHTQGLTETVFGKKRNSPSWIRLKLKVYSLLNITA